MPKNVIKLCNWINLRRSSQISTGISQGYPWEDEFHMTTNSLLTLWKLPSDTEILELNEFMTKWKGEVYIEVWKEISAER